MTDLVNPKVRSVLGVHRQGALSVSFQDKIDISTQTINKNSIQEPETERSQFGASVILETENQSQRSVDSRSVPSASLSSEVKATPSAFVEKYEMGSGKNKINVRIFKEPPAESDTLEPQKDEDTKQRDARL